MEYFSSSGDTDGMSLEDMINCDIKSEFSEHSHTAGDGIRILSGPLTSVDINGTNVSSYDSSVHTSANTTSGLDLTPQDAMLNTDADPRLGSDCNWMQNINVNSLRQLFQPQQQQQVSSQVRVGTPEPSILMVNPQTGLPVQNRQVSSPVSRAPPTPQQNSSSTAQAHSAIQAALLQTSPQIQYITINNIAGLPSASVQNFGTQGNLINSNLSPMQISYAHTNGMSQVTQQLLTTNHSRAVPKAESQDKIFPKPVYSYSCLIALALKNSENGCLPVSEIYNFMTENFPYFKTAPDGWKNSVRHNLSLNKCFEKIENPKANGSTKKGCLWGLNPVKIEKMEEELAKWRKKDPVAIKKSMAKPDILEQLERGIFKVETKHKPGYEAAPPIVDLPPIKVEPIHIEPVADPVIRIKEVKVHEGNGNTLLSTVNADDLNLLDNGLTLDPSLHDLALQGEILEDLTHDVFKMDHDLPMSSGTSSQGIPSPLTIVSSPSNAQNEMGQVSAANGTYQGAYTYTNFNTSNQVTTNGYSVSRTVSAQT